MTTGPEFATVVIYAADVTAAVEFYERALGLAPSHFDRELGFALLGADRRIGIASHEAGAFMLAAGYDPVRADRVRAAEVAFWVEDVGATFAAALAAGAAPLTPPRTMPWGQTVAYVEAPEGTILGFVTRLDGGAAS